MNETKRLILQTANTLWQVKIQLYEYLSLAQWLTVGQRPKLDRRRMEHHLLRLSNPINQGSKSLKLSLLVHVAFHFAPSRLKYLKETIEQISALPFNKIDIVVDTNKDYAARLVENFPKVSEVKVWKSLPHPFRLTWVHRQGLQTKIEDYDAYMYIEDDLLIPEKTILRWAQETEKLEAYGFVPGFVRVEENLSAELVLSDFRFPVERGRVLMIEGTPYLATPFPYQACWIYSRTQMKKFVRSPTYLQGAIYPEILLARDGEIGIREKFAVGSIFDDVPHGLPSRALVPLTSDYRISPDALIFHMPSNYGQISPPGHPAGLGTVKLSDGIISIENDVASSVAEFLQPQIRSDT